MEYLHVDNDEEALDKVCTEAIAESKLEDLSPIVRLYVKNLREEIVARDSTIAKQEDYIIRLREIVDYIEEVERND